MTRLFSHCKDGVSPLGADLPPGADLPLGAGLPLGADLSPGADPPPAYSIVKTRR